MDAITLTAIARPSDIDQGNLFVRLTPRTAWRLARMIHSDYEKPLLSEECNVEFLPLEITFQIHNQLNAGGHDVLGDDYGVVTIYASYNGGAPAPFICPSLVRPYGGKFDDVSAFLSIFGISNLLHYFNIGYDEDVIELPLDLHPSLASAFNTTSEPIKVSVRPLLDVPIAEQVIFEPLSTSDWELIEMEASLLEDGGLLNQVTIVYPGQVFPLRLSSGETYSCRLESAAWIKVAEQSFASSLFQNDSDDTDSMFTSKSDSSESSLCKIRYNCLRLMAETEVSVIPKPRINNEKEKESSLVRDPTKSIDPVYAYSCPLRVEVTFPIGHETNITSVSHMPPLGCVYVHSSTLKQLPGYQQMFEKELSFMEKGSGLPSAVVLLEKWDSKNCIDGNDGILARISASDLVRKGHINMNQCLRIQIGVTPLSDWLRVQIWPISRVVDRIARSQEEIAQGNKPIRLISSSLEEPPRDEQITITSAIQSTALINSGCIAPVAALRSLIPPGIDWLDQLCLGHLAICLQSTTEDKSDSAALMESATTGADLKHNQDITPGEGIFTSVNNDSIPPLNAYLEGFSSTVERLTHDINKIISLSRSRTCGLIPHRNAIMITGDVGSGKTHLALTVSSRLFRSDSIALVYLDCKTLQATPGSTLTSILDEIQNSCQQAMHKQPSLLILDDLDALIPNNDSSDGSGDGSIHHKQTNSASLVNQVKAVVDHLLWCSNHCGDSNVVFLCTCRGDDALATRYKNSGKIYSSVEVPPLNSHERTRFLHNYLLGNRPKKDTSVYHIPNCVSKLGKMTDGFRPHDLKLISTRIRNAQYLRRLEYQSQTKNSDNNFTLGSGKVSLELLEDDIASVIEDFTPLSQQSIDTHSKVSVDWSSVGGLKRAKQCLYDVIIHPMTFKKIYHNSPLSLPTGVLLYGYPGSGKSFIVPALAKASNLSLITCRGPELLDRYIGASEAKVRHLFAQAVTAAPSMIFFDEFDSLAPQRGSDHTGVTDRVVNQLLTLLDGAERNKNTSQIYIVAATSRPDKIDKALLRPGRLETHVYFGYPESLIEWEELFSSILSSWNVDEEVRLLRQKGELYTSLCKDLSHAKDLSAADLKAVMDTAHLIRVHEMLDADDDDDNSEKPKLPKVIVGKRHIILAFRRTRPSLLPEDRQKLQNYYKPFHVDVKKLIAHHDVRDHNLKTSFR